MKYTTKTAVHVTDEFTRQNLIEFFEAIKSDCNKRAWKERDIEIGEYWYLTKAGLLNYRDSLDEYDFTDYTIIQGIPENWREEMEKEPETELQSKINQLETRINELEQCLKLTYQQLKMWNTDFPFNNEDVELKNTIEKLLNK